MYLPKSHITPDLYSNGELSIVGSNTPYVGSYFKTIDGKNYTGRYPNDGKNLELTESTPSNQNEDTGTFEIDYRFTSPNYAYSTARKENPDKLPTSTPTPFYPLPTQQDYELGEFTRYFAKKTNENLYTETSAIFKNSLYIGFQIPWLITGDKNNVANVNRNIVKLREQELNISGFGDFLRHNYLKFYK